MKIRIITRNIAFTILSFFVFLLLVELLLHTIMPIIKPKFTKIDPVLGWYHNSNTSHVREIEGHSYRLSYNSHGFRVPEHSYEKPEGTKRIILLGDSYLDGSDVGDEETFTWLLQNHLKEVEVINLGVYSYGTAQELLLLEKVGLRYDPDLVILVTMTNDYVDNLLNFSSFGPAPRYVFKDDSIELQSTDHPDAQRVFRLINLPFPAMRFLHERSRIYYLINQYIYRRLIANRIVDIISEQKQSLNEDNRLELYIRIVSRIKAICDSSGIDFKLVFVYPKEKLLNSNISPSTETAIKLRERGIDVIDLYNVLKEKELRSEKSIYYQYDFHWNARGHQFVAENLLPHIQTWLDGSILNLRE